MRQIATPHTAMARETGKGMGMFGLWCNVDQLRRAKLPQVHNPRVPQSSAKGQCTKTFAQARTAERRAQRGNHAQRRTRKPTCRQARDQRTCALKNHQGGIAVPRSARTSEETGHWPRACCQRAQTRPKKLSTKLRPVARLEGARAVGAAKAAVVRAFVTLLAVVQAARAYQFPNAAVLSQHASASPPK